MTPFAEAGAFVVSVPARTAEAAPRQAGGLRQALLSALLQALSAAWAV